MNLLTLTPISKPTIPTDLEELLKKEALGMSLTDWLAYHRDIWFQTNIPGTKTPPIYWSYGTQLPSIEMDGPFPDRDPK